MIGQDRPPTYPAERAANVVLGLSVVAAIVCASAGIFQLRRSAVTTGWLLIAVGILPLIGAVLVRATVGRR